ncbi:para-nitrobenzyl esterase [Rhodococcus olei]|uniref:Carboxylic ester hydrolase n=1 Tax=Rhodococcus olei TaxID=2161675 RepID=A0ABP8NYV4_9NOCA
MPERGVVQTGSGQVRGVLNNGVWSFKGVPYAASPEGPRRFGAPEPAESWDGVRPATAYGPSVPQRPMRGLVADMFPMNPVQGFDALHLNVWTPDPSAKGLPVLVWIHGGGFRSGSGNDELYDGSAFAGDGVVTVTINYRLGVEGFLYLGDRAPDPAVTGAMGIADQVAALRWVQENISGFGGDPSNVTIAGESAGAMSVATLLAVPSADGLFQRAICQSGGADKVNGIAESSRITTRLLEKLGATGDDLTPLFDASAEDLLVVQDAMAAELASGEFVHLYGVPATLATIAFLPTSGTDLIPEEPLTGLARRSTTVDLLVGENADECSIFLAGVPDDIVASMGRAKLATWLGEGESARILAHLGEALPDSAERDRWIWLESERQFWSPVRRLALTNAARGGRTYKYRFDWASDLHDGLGAHHVIELPFVFGTGSTRQAKAIARNLPENLVHAVRTAWVDFIHGRVPRLPDGVLWPAYTSESQMRVRLAEERISTVPDIDELGLDEAVTLERIS